MTASPRQDPDELDDDLDGLLEVAVDLARRAGALALTMREGISADATKSSPTDVVTAADRAVERLLLDGLRDARPDDGVLGEEGASRTGRTGLRWVVDPVDGTVNYLYGLPNWSVSVAVERDRSELVGVVFDPVRDELFSAVRGRGSRLGDRPLACTSATDLAQSLVATGFGYDARRRAAQAAALSTVLPRVRDLRRFGSSALDLCAVAAGRLDGYFEQGLSPWDLAAGGLVAREAGARVEGLDGSPAGFPLVVAAGPGVFDALHDLLVEVHADADPVGDFPWPDPYSW